jgi:wyosine [tRNA(Phe)-imidazoG37] synthetase (radical SAM superfamily)
MKYVYGPVKSRRLGLSLGISIIGHKSCNFDCVYCQLGKTTNKTDEIKEYAKTEDVLAELKEFLCNRKEEISSLNYITLSGSGEPTLNIRIGELIPKIKEISSLPVAVITNSALLIDERVRQSLFNADLVIPSLDAAEQDVFNKINQPVGNLKIEDIIESLIKLRREFKGKIWLEVMLIRGINDKLGHIRKLKAVVEKINPDKIQLNSPVRLSSESNILPASKKKLAQFKEILGDKCEII